MAIELPPPVPVCVLGSTALTTRSVRSPWLPLVVQLIHLCFARLLTVPINRSTTFEVQGTVIPCSASDANVVT